MLGHEATRLMPLRVMLALLAALTALCLPAAQAQAAPGSYQILIAEAFEEGAKELQGQITAFPDVAKVDLVDTENSTPTAAQLAPYDLVVSIGDSSYGDPEAWGNSLASYIDGGGAVVQATYDTWEFGFPEGRFASGGYAPFIPGPNDNDPTTLGEFDSSNPLMQGVAPGSLFTEDNTTNALAPGATLIAKWADGRPAIAQKGRVVAITAFIGDHYGSEVWDGNYGQIIVNAVRNLTPQPLTITNSNPAGGTVTSSPGGINCGPTCSATFSYKTAVALTATPNKGFAFAGFGGACTGTACALTMDGPKSATANFTAFGFGKGIKRNKKKGTAKVPVTVGTAGTLELSGKKIKKRLREVAAGTTKLTVAAKGKARKKLLKTGKVKVQMTLTFTPAGGTPAVLTKTIQLKRKIR